ncbi:MAG TPA: FixH family protein [Brumimicrobium sp.]|nr:FixH family protein [Brumimicrobium sp.]
MKKIFLLSLISVFVFASCKKDKKDDVKQDGTTPVSEYKLIKKDTASNDLIVELFAKTETIEMGYTKLYVKVKDLNGNAVENAMVSFMPMMDMGSMQHSSPFENPVFKSSSKFYEGMVIFTMASDHGTWELTVTVNGEDVDLPINVLSSPTGIKNVGSYNGTDGKKYIVSLVRPVKWVMGVNDISVMVHRGESMMMSFPPVDDFTIEMDPQMTSMGHGSHNNISPTSDGNGYYSGKVTYTMTGDWKINLDLIKDGDLIANADLDILF